MNEQELTERMITLFKIVWNNENATEEDVETIGFIVAQMIFDLHRCADALQAIAGELEHD